MKKEEIEYLINEFGFKDESNKSCNIIRGIKYKKKDSSFAIGSIILYKRVQDKKYELYLEKDGNEILLNDNCILEDVIALLHIIK